MTRPPPAPPASPLRTWGAVALLTGVGILNIVDRFLPAVLAQPIKHDLMLSDTALGLINGFGFLIVYAVVGIPIARLSDRGRYGVMISGCVALWSAMTLLGGFAQAGWQLAVTRMGVAVGEAGSTPAAHAFISRNFRPDRRGAPLALLTLSVPIAGVVGLAGGGLLGEAIGWRMTFVVMGVAGFVLAPFVYLLLGRNNTPTASPAGPVQKAPTSLRSAGVLLKKPTYVLILAGCACIGIGGYSLSTFAPAYLMRVHGFSLGEVGVDYGVTAGVMGMASLFAVGALADRLSAQDPRWLLRVVVLMILVLLPFSIAAFLVPDRGMAVAFIALSNTIATAYMVPVVAAIQRLTPPDLRATASAVMLFCTSLIGGAGPFLTGLMSDAFEPHFGTAALGRALLIVPLMHALAAIFYFAASRRFQADVVADEPISG